MSDARQDRNSDSILERGVYCLKSNSEKYPIALPHLRCSLAGNSQSRGRSNVNPESNKVYPQPVLNAESFQRLLAAAYVLQVHGERPSQAVAASPKAFVRKCSGCPEAHSIASQPVLPSPIFVPNARQIWRERARRVSQSRVGGGSKPSPSVEFFA